MRNAICMALAAAALAGWTDDGARVYGTRLVGGPLAAFREGCKATFVSRINPDEHAEAFLRIGSPRPGILNARPEFAGHYLDLCATYWELDRLPEAAANARRVVAAAKSGAGGTGYLGGEYEGRRRDYFSLWNQAHAVYGLARCAMAFDDAAMKTQAVCAADWLAATWEDMGAKVVGGAGAEGCQHLAGLYSFDLMYDLTGDWKYLTLIGRMLGIFEKETGMKLLSAKGCLDLPSRKGIEMLNGMRGVLGYGRRAWGNRNAIEAAGRYWASIADGQVWCTGSSTAITPSEPKPERFTKEGNAPRILTDGEMANENCVQCGWLRLTREYFEATGEPRCADEFERTIFNHTLGSVAADGSDFAYYQCNRGRKVFSKNSYYQCCRYRGFAIAAHLPELVLDDDGSSVTPLAYAPLEHRALDGFRLSVRTDYPSDGRIVLTACGGSGRNLRLRVPAWCPGYALTVGGKAVDAQPKGGFLVVRVSSARPVEVVLTLEMPFRRRACEIDGRRYVEYTWGPLALVRDTHYGDRLGDPLPEGLQFRRVAAKDGPFAVFEATDAEGRRHTLVDYAHAGRHDPERDEFELYIPAAAKWSSIPSR